MKMCQFYSISHDQSGDFPHQATVGVVAPPVKSHAQQEGTNSRRNMLIMSTGRK